MGPTALRGIRATGDTLSNVESQVFTPYKKFGSTAGDQRSEVNAPSDMSCFQTRDEVLNFLRNTLNEVQEPVFENLDTDFTMKELKAAIKDLGNNKAAGQDGLVNEIFKNVVDLQPAMLTLFNRILSTGHFPIQWTEGIIVPIYKKVTEIRQQTTVVSLS